MNSMPSATATPLSRIRPIRLLQSACRWAVRTRVTFPRITVESHKMGGQPCIRGLRIPVATVVAMVGDGMTVNEILFVDNILRDANITANPRPVTRKDAVEIFEAAL